MKISRTDLKYLVDILMFLCMLGVIVIGLLQAFIIPEGPTQGAISKYFLGLHRHQWGGIHLYLSLAFVVFLAVHIILEWSWIRGKTQKIFRKGWKAALAVMVLAAALIPVLFWGVTMKNDPAYAEYGTGEGRRGGRSGEAERLAPAIDEPLPAKVTQEAPASVEPKSGGETASAGEQQEDKTVAGRLASEPVEFVVTGQTTLADIERATGLAAADVAAKLGLPSNVSSSETLGRLRRRYGFTMEQVREIVAAAIKEKKD